MASPVEDYFLSLHLECEDSGLSSGEQNLAQLVTSARMHCCLIWQRALTSHAIQNLLGLTPFLRLFPYAGPVLLHAGVIPCHRQCVRHWSVALLENRCLGMLPHAEPLLDAVGDSYDAGCEGSAFYALQSCLNQQLRPQRARLQARRL